MSEDGSDLAEQLWAAADRTASSVLAYPEARAAFAAARRAGRLTDAALTRSREDFDAVFDELLVVGIDERLARHAGDLADAFGLRGYDAVHLAGALLLGEDTIVVTWDRALGRAAARIGCGVAPGLQRGRRRDA